jgi:hypothetical protein
VPDSASKGPMFQFTHSRDGGDDIRFGFWGTCGVVGGDQAVRRVQQMRVEGLCLCLCLFVFVSAWYTVLGSPVCSLVWRTAILISRMARAAMCK